MQDTGPSIRFSAIWRGKKCKLAHVKFSSLSACVLLTNVRDYIVPPLEALLLCTVCYKLVENRPSDMSF